MNDYNCASSGINLSEAHTANFNFFAALFVAVVQVTRKPECRNVNVLTIQIQLRGPHDVFLLCGPPGHGSEWKQVRPCCQIASAASVLTCSSSWNTAGDKHAVCAWKTFRRNCGRLLRCRYRGTPACRNQSVPSSTARGTCAAALPQGSTRRTSW
ncbi:unnamed protein product [Amoebophrya sp. A120]|nr:unnamed protein product [Amoebophrya sp. A120]|eukprot:GSA120T00001639001.1